MKTSMGRTLLAGLFLAAATGAALAQDYPKRPIRVVVAFPAGGSADIVARIVTQKVSEMSGYNFVVENRPGAGGNLAFGNVATSEADGYTLLFSTPGIAINPSLYRKVEYKLEDFKSIAVVGEAPRPLRRAGAAAGDLIVVTGRPGAASAGLALLERGLRLREDGEVVIPPALPPPSPEREQALRACLAAQIDPAPPLFFAATLGRLTGVRAGMDVSDGLSGDLFALCAESGVAGVMDAAALPESPAAALGAWGAGDPLAHVLHGGEDYGLLLAVAPDAITVLTELAGAHHVAVSVVGAFEKGEGVFLREGGGRRPLPPRAHQHFARRTGA